MVEYMHAPSFLSSSNPFPSFPFGTLHVPFFLSLWDQDLALYPSSKVLALSCIYVASHILDIDLPLPLDHWAMLWANTDAETILGKDKGGPHRLLSKPTHFFLSPSLFLFLFSCFLTIVPLPSFTPLPSSRHDR